MLDTFSNEAIFYKVGTSGELTLKWTVSFTLPCKKKTIFAQDGMVKYLSSSSLICGH